jgi:hypothetical protein
MKTYSLVLAAALAAAASVRSQDAPVADSRKAVVAPAVTSTTARILGNIPDGTPPPPAAPKPEFIVPRKDIVATTTHEQGGRTITIQKIKPIDLPPPPEPVVQRMMPADNPAFQARLAEYRASHPAWVTIPLGATVYRSKDTPPRSLVRYWPKPTGKSITFWSSADFALISGIHSFVANDGQTRWLFMSWGNMDIERQTALHAARGREYHAPNIPEFPVGNATFTIVGDAPADAADLIPIQSLHDLYNREFERLKIAYEGREQARLQREADLKANPPRPKDITLNYWRSEKPASNGKGIAR